MILYPYHSISRFYILNQTKSSSWKRSVATGEEAPRSSLHYSSCFEAVHRCITKRSPCLLHPTAFVSPSLKFFAKLFFKKASVRDSTTPNSMSCCVTLIPPQKGAQDHCTSSDRLVNLVKRPIQPSLTFSREPWRFLATMTSATDCSGVSSL